MTQDSFSRAESGVHATGGVSESASPSRHGVGLAPTEEKDGGAIRVPSSAALRRDAIAVEAEGEVQYTQEELEAQEKVRRLEREAGILAGERIPGDASSLASEVRAPPRLLLLVNPRSYYFRSGDRAVVLADDVSTAAKVSQHGLTKLSVIGEASDSEGEEIDRLIAAAKAARARRNARQQARRKQEDQEHRDSKANITAAKSALRRAVHNLNADGRERIAAEDAKKRKSGRRGSLYVGGETVVRLPSMYKHHDSSKKKKHHDDDDDEDEEEDEGIEVEDDEKDESIEVQDDEEEEGHREDHATKVEEDEEIAREKEIAIELEKEQQRMADQWAAWEEERKMEGRRNLRPSGHSDEAKRRLRRRKERLRKKKSKSKKKRGRDKFGIDGESDEDSDSNMSAELQRRLDRLVWVPPLPNQSDLKDPRRPQFRLGVVDRLSAVAAGGSKGDGSRSKAVSVLPDSVTRHILVTGELNGIHEFVRALRGATNAPVVALAPAGWLLAGSGTSAADDWGAACRHHSDLWYVDGSPLRTVDLARAGLSRARAVVVLAAQAGHGFAGVTGDAASIGGAAWDLSAIFTATTVFTHNTTRRFGPKAAPRMIGTAVGWTGASAAPPASGASTAPKKRSVRGSVTADGSDRAARDDMATESGVVDQTSGPRVTVELLQDSSVRFLGATLQHPRVADRQSAVRAAVMRARAQEMQRSVRFHSPEDGMDDELATFNLALARAQEEAGMGNPAILGADTSSSRQGFRNSPARLLERMPPRLRSHFASGTCFLGSTLDSLLVQLYFNPLILRVLDKIIQGASSSPASVPEVYSGLHRTYSTRPNDLSFAPWRSATPSKPAKAPRSSTSARRPTRLDDPSASLHGFTPLYKENGFVRQLQIPPKFHGRRYHSLFCLLLANHRILPLALYRSPHALGAPTPYVVTNPPPTVRLHRKDRVFVLCGSEHLQPRHVPRPPAANNSQAPASPPPPPSPSLTEKSSSGSEHSEHSETDSETEEAQRWARYHQRQALNAQTSRADGPEPPQTTRTRFFTPMFNTGGASNQNEHS